MGNPRRNISNLFSYAVNYAQTDLIDPNGPNDYRNVKIVGGDRNMCRLPLSTATSDYDFAFSDRFIEDGSYLRIQNISLGYTFPKINQQHRPFGFKSFCKYSECLYFHEIHGYDPEVGISYSGGNQLRV